MWTVFTDCYGPVSGACASVTDFHRLLLLLEVKDLVEVFGAGADLGGPGAE